MNTDIPSYRGCRYPGEIISYVVWLYFRFRLSVRDIEDPAAERRVIVSHETIRQWCHKTIRGQRHCIWRAVDQDGGTLDIFVQRQRNERVAERFYRKLLIGQGASPRRMTTDKFRSYSAARRTTLPSVPHVTDRYATNRAEVSHQPTRERERCIRRFKSPGHAQRFHSVHAVVGNRFRIGRHPTRTTHYCLLRSRAVDCWQEVMCA